MNGVHELGDDEEATRRSIDALVGVNRDDDVELDIPSLSELLGTAITQKSVDLNAPSSSSYLAHLSSLPLPLLLAEPALISHESSTVEAELTNLCYREYGTFISIHECSSAVTTAFDDFSTSLDGLLASVPDLEAECRAFADSTLAIQKERRRAGVVQEHQDKLLDVLEIPRLMDTCVRNGYYAEALELEAHARDLMDRYGDIPLIQDVVQQVERVRQLMLAQLLALLREPVKLPTLVKAVNFLRRMDMQDSLPIAFLISRQHNLRAQLVSIEKDRTEPTRYVRRYIDIFREHVYDIISQYTAIFIDTADPATVDTRHLTTFAQTQLEALLSLLESMIPKINDPASLSSILIQLGYCSLSFARVGLDFADLVVRPFERAVEKTFTDACAEAAARFATIFRDAIRNGVTPAELLMLHDHMPELDALQSAQTDMTQPPPLSAYPPIGTLLNSHITALNALRLLAPQSLHLTLQQVQATSLTASSKTLLSYIQLATSDHTFLPPVSLSRSNSQSKHSRNPSASLRRRATGQGLSQTLVQNKVSIAAVKAFKVAAKYLMGALDAAVYEGVGEYDQRVWAELDDWLRAVEPPKSVALESVNDAPKPLVDEPSAMAKRKVTEAHAEAQVAADALGRETEEPLPLPCDASLGPAENREVEMTKAAEDAELVEDGLVMAPAEAELLTAKQKPATSGASPVVQAARSVAEASKGISDIMVRPSLSSPATTLAAADASKVEEEQQSSLPHPPILGDSEEPATSLGPASDVVAESLEVNMLEGAEEASALQSVQEGQLSEAAHGVEEKPDLATAEASALIKTKTVVQDEPTPADLLDQAPSAEVSNASAANVVLVDTPHCPSPKPDMEPLFQAPTGAKQDEETSTPVQKPAILVEPVPVSSGDPVESAPAEAETIGGLELNGDTIAQPLATVLGASLATQPDDRAAESLKLQTDSQPESEMANGASDVQQNAEAPNTIANLTEVSAEPGDQTAVSSATPGSSTTEAVGTSGAALDGVIASSASTFPAPSEAQIPSAPAFNNPSTNPSRAPSPDNIGPAKTSGSGASKKKNKKKGKKK